MEAFHRDSICKNSAPVSHIRNAIFLFLSKLDERAEMIYLAQAAFDSKLVQWRLPNVQTNAHVAGVLQTPADKAVTVASLAVVVVGVASVNIQCHRGT